MIQYLVTARLCSGILDGRPALNLAAARLRHIVRTKWSTKRYMNTQLLKPKEMIASPTRSGQVRAYLKLLGVYIIPITKFIRSICSLPFSQQLSRRVPIPITDPRSRP